MDETTHIKTDPAPDYIRSFLKAPPAILKNFHHDDIMEFLECGERKHFTANETVIRESLYANDGFLVAEGEIEIWKENIQLFAPGKGTFLGESFLFDKNYHSPMVISRGKSIIIHFDRPSVLNFFRRKPEKLFNIFTCNIIKIQRNDIIQAREQLYHLKKRLLKEPR